MSRKRPNILFFIADDQRFDTIHALGNEQIITPHLDELARTGTALTHTYLMGGSCPAVCVPSRAMLLTGKTLFRLRECGLVIPPEHTSLPEVLRQAGYTTCGIGKWHNGKESYARGFMAGDRIFFGGMSDHFQVPLYPFDPAGQYPDKKMYVKQGQHSSDLFGDAAVQFLHKYTDDNPFFLYVAFTAPHDPRQTHPRYHKLYPPGKLPLPQNFLPEHPFDNGELKIRDEQLAPWPRTPEIVKQHLSDYYAMVTHMDEQIGRVLTALRKSGHEENTIVIHTADHGLAVGQHGLMGKQNVYDHSVRIPLLIRGPGIPQDRRIDALCYLYDLFPTLCDLLDLPIPRSVEGRSFAPILRGQQRKHRETVFAAYRDWQRMVRDERFKLIEYAVEGDRHTQLFDLKTDPCETNDLAGAAGHDAQIQRLRTILARWQNELDDPWCLDPA